MTQVIKTLFDMLLCISGLICIIIFHMWWDHGLRTDYLAIPIFLVMIYLRITLSSHLTKGKKEDTN